MKAGDAAAIDAFCDALWLEDGLARNTLDGYRRDLAQFASWLDAQLAIFDKVYGAKRPRYLDGYKMLKEAIKPWGSK